MEYKKFVETFQLCGGHSHLTKNLPTKWTCSYSAVNQKLRFNYCDGPANGLTVVEYGYGHVVFYSKTLTREIGYENNTFTAAGATLSITISEFFPISSLLPLVGMDVCDNNTVHDHVLKVGDKKFYVKKSLLSFYSSFFDRMFNGDFEEAKKDETTLEEVDATEFGTLLQMLYPGTREITEKNVVFLWKLADRFAIPSIAKMCEEYVCALGTDDISTLKLSERLELAKQYNSEKLMIAVTELLKSMNK